LFLEVISSHVYNKRERVKENTSLSIEGHLDIRSAQQSRREKERGRHTCMHAVRKKVKKVRERKCKSDL
jgi:hypothetical protein